MTAKRPGPPEALSDLACITELMLTGWQYRLTSVAGVAVATMLAVLVANEPLTQALFTTYVPVFWALSPTVLSDSDLWLALALPTVVVAGCLVPLYKPRPRRILDIVAIAQKRVVVAACIIATLGYFNYSYRLPRATLVMTAGFLVVALPAWFVAIRHPTTDPERAIIVGDHPEAMHSILNSTDLPIIGYVAPSSLIVHDRSEESPVTIADGGASLAELECLGGLSRLDEVFVEHDVDTALLAFPHPDRAEFFGTLDACYDHGVTAKVHREHMDSVLTTGFGSDKLVDVDLEPWDTLDHVFKRGFDIVFAVAGLVVTAPVMVCIAAAIKLDDGGSALYSQERTASFGDTFTVYKFRTMVENVESVSGARISDEDSGDIDPRVTRVGRLLRQTHLDELPQLWSILVGDMSVVGPRPERPVLEPDMERDVREWRRRWFVKPGLTGLAQINDATGHQPEEKLRYDIEYIRCQSVWFDSKIVVRQFWKVFHDAMDSRW